MVMRCLPKRAHHLNLINKLIFAVQKPRLPNFVFIRAPIIALTHYEFSRLNSLAIFKTVISRCFCRCGPSRRRLADARRRLRY
jgi:hypothetical protein